MPTASFLALMSLFAAALLLLLGSGRHEHARTRERRDGNATQAIATANLRAALATSSARNDVDTAQPHLSASQATLYDSRIQSAARPTRSHEYAFSCERTTGEAARPPPLQA